MAVERREKDGGGGGRGGKDRNLTLVDVYDIAADIGKVSDGVAEVAREHGWHPPKSLDSDENFKPTYAILSRYSEFS